MSFVEAHFWRKHMFKKFGTKRQVFLGGSCGSTTWRKDIAIPMLEREGVRFFNPQLPEGAWKQEDAITEAKALKESNVVVIIVDSSTRATRSLLELVEIAMRGQRVIAVLERITDGAVIEGQAVTGRDLKDLNDTRDWVREFGKRYSNVIQALSVEHAISMAIEFV